MKISEFVSIVTKSEGKKSSVSVGNVREVLSIVNKLLDGEVYKAVRKKVLAKR